MLVRLSYLLSRIAALSQQGCPWGRIFLLFLFFLQLGAPAFAQQDTFSLTTGTTFHNLSGKLYCLDENLTTPLPEMSTAAVWRLCNRHDLFIQPPQTSPWIRIKLRNPTDQARWLLKVSGHQLADIDMYRELPSGKISPLPADDPSLFLYSLELGPDQQETLILKARADFDTFLQLSIGQQGDYYQHYFWTTLIQGFFLGTLAIMLLYNFCLYLWLKEKNYRCYSLYLFSAIIYILADTGLGRHFLWPGFLWLKSHDYTLFAAFCFATATLFIRRFLQLRQQGGWVYSLSNCFLVAWTIITLGALLFTSLPFRLTLYGFGFLSIIAGLVTSGYLWYRGSLPARQYTIAYVMLYLGTTLHILGLTGLIPWTAWTEYAQLAGFTIEFSLLSLALADAMNRNLEERVAERTTALELALNNLEVANYELANQSLIDPLTEIHNRRYFDQVFINEMQRGIRSNIPLSVLMIDIDHFKSVNDRFGHLQGDECLRQIARSLSSQVERSNDLLARYGGEEFIILLPGTIQDNAVIFAERLLATVRRNPLQVNDQLVPVTVSIGVAGWIPAQGEEIDILQEAADKALYRAKAAGRNCIRAASEADRPNLQLQLLQE